MYIRWHLLFVQIMESLCYYRSVVGRKKSSDATWILYKRLIRRCVIREVHVIQIFVKAVGI